MDFFNYDKVKTTLEANYILSLGFPSTLINCMRVDERSMNVINNSTFAAISGS